MKNAKKQKVFKIIDEEIEYNNKSYASFFKRSLDTVNENDRKCYFEIANRCLENNFMLRKLKCRIDKEL